MKDNLLQQRRKQKEKISNQCDHPVSSNDCQTVVDKPSKTQPQKKSQLEKKRKSDQANKLSTRTLSTSSINDLSDENNEDNNGSIEYTLSSTAASPEEQEGIKSPSNHSCETSTVVETNQEQIYLEKINDLMNTITKQAKIIKKQNDELQKFRQTTIGNF